MTHDRLFCRRRILGPNDQAYLDRWPLALTLWGRVYLHRFHAPDPASTIIRGHSGRWSCGAATGKPRKPGRPTGASGHWPTARRRGRIVSPGCTHGARRGRWSSPGRRCGCGAFSRRRVGWNSGEPTAGESVDVSGAAQSRSQTRPLPALSGRPPAQHRLRSATASASTRTVPGLARRRPPLGQGPAGQVWRGWSDWQAVSPVARLTPPVVGTARADTILAGVSMHV